jgi:cytochrome c peroxidase
VTHGSPVEKYVKGEFAALGPGAKRGLKVFIGKAACNDCHNGPLLSDNKYHNIGVPTSAALTTPELGRFTDLASIQTSPFNSAGEFSDDMEYGKMKLATLPVVDDAMKGQFRTSMLLNVSETGPYFHSGLVTSLEEVVQHYNNGGGAEGTFSGVKDAKLKRLSLTDGESADLVEFLKQLTAPLPEDWARKQQ